MLNCSVRRVYADSVVVHEIASTPPDSNSNYYFRSIQLDGSYAVSGSGGSGALPAYGYISNGNLYFHLDHSGGAKFSILTFYFTNPIHLHKDYRYEFSYGIYGESYGGLNDPMIGAIEFYDSSNNIIDLLTFNYKLAGSGGPSPSTNVTYTPDRELTITHVMLVINHTMINTACDMYLSPVHCVQRVPVSVEAIGDAADRVQGSIDSQTDQLIQGQQEQTSAIGGFFQSLLNGIMSLFIPSQAYFDTFFSDLNSWMSDHFGALYYPISLIVDIGNRLVNLPVGDQPSITLPGVEIQGQKLWDTTTYTFDFSDGLGLGTIYQLYLTVVDCIIAIALVNLAKHKMEQIQRGS